MLEGSCDAVHQHSVQPFDIRAKFSSTRRLAGMTSPHVYWHIYPQHQIKVGLRGNLICVLEVPWIPGTPVVREILDPMTLDFPGRAPLRFPALLRPNHHGILYLGVSKPGVDHLMMTDPPLNQVDPSYASYNRQVVTNTRNFLLVDPNRGFQTMPQHMVQLL